MNGYMCINVRNDTLHTHIFMTCLRQYLFTIVVLRWLLVPVLFDHLGSSLGSRYVCCMLCGMVHNKLVYNNHAREAEASTSSVILFGCIANCITLVVPLYIVALASGSLCHVKSLLNTSKKVKAQQIICPNILVLLETYIRKGFVKKIGFNRRA